MNPTVRKNVYWLIASVVVIALCVIWARSVETDFGQVDVQRIAISDPTGVVLVGKLYRPVAATPKNKLPGVLTLHGYQNDKETMDASAIELSRRGFVVLALDQFGQGDSGGRLAMRGADPTIGANAGYHYLKGLPFVDGNDLGVMGHSMGALSTVAVGAANPDVKALNPQCGVPGSPALPNLLLTQAKFDEFQGFRENQLTTQGLQTNPSRLKGLGLTGEAKWDTIYGDFSKGTAREQALIDTVHPGVTHNPKAVALAVDWMDQALKGGQKGPGWIPSNQQIYMSKEYATFLALLIALFSIIPLTNILLETSYFKKVAQPLPNRYTTTGRSWLGLAIINILIAGITYPILTAYGGLTDKVGKIFPWFQLPMGNGVMLWFLGNVVIYVILFGFWYRTSGKRAGVTMYDMGVSFDENKTTFDWSILGRTLLLGVILFSWMYVLEGISQWSTGIEFRFLWPFMRQFSPHRFLLFLLYLIPALLFFLFNGGIFLFGQARQKEYGSPARTTTIWWLKNVFAAIFGLVLVWLVQYVPYFMGKGPGFELLGLPQYSQMWPLMILVFVPEFIPLVFLLTWFFRRTGKVYLGALMVAAIAIWFTAAGSVIL